MWRIAGAILMFLSLNWLWWEMLNLPADILGLNMLFIPTIAGRHRRRILLHSLLRPVNHQTPVSEMIRTYENFEELADAMCKGDSILHLYNCAQHRGVDPCIAWQTGVRAFAEWLDHIGCKVQIPDSAEDFYEFSAKEYKRNT